MSAGPARFFLVAAAAVLLLVTGCTVKEPDADAWRDQARQTLDDVASEVATARLTLEQLDHERLPASYGVTVLADAEQAASTAEEGLSSLQPPPRLGKLVDRVLALIGRAVEAVQQAREVAVSGGTYDAPALVAELDRLHTRLDEQRAAL